jgi:hypothetical protein
MVNALLLLHIFFIQCTPSVMECGTVIIGTSQQRTLTLINPTSSDLHYRLKASDSIDGQPISTSSCSMYQLE